MADEHLDAHRTAPLSKRAKKMKSVFAVGANVIIVCLVTRVDLNGRSATVHSRDVQRDCWIGTPIPRRLLDWHRYPDEPHTLPLRFRLTQGACDVPQSW